MKVALVQHPLQDFYSTTSRMYPLALCLLASALEDICDVEIIDCRTTKKPTLLQTHPFPELNEYYRPELSGPFSLFSRFFRFGMSQEQIEHEIRRIKPDVVGISCPISTYYQDCVDTIKLIKEIDDSIIIVAGGLHATLYPEDFLDLDYVDYVIRGEGSTAMRRLIEHILQGISRTEVTTRGICFRKEARHFIHEIALEQDIDSVPAHSLLDPDNYTLFRKKYAFMMTSFGCPLKCKFCGKADVPFRTRSMQSLEAEFDLLDRRRIRILDLEDDMINYNSDHFSQVLDLLTHYSFEVYAMNGIFPANLSESILRAMATAGFRKVNLPIVTSSTRILTDQARHHSTSIARVIKGLETLDLLCEAHFIIGLPGQDVDTILHTIIFLMEHKLLLGPSVYYAVPGSAYWKDDAQPFEQCRSSVIYPHHLKRRTIFTLMKLVRFINFCKNLVDRADVCLSVSDIINTKDLFATERAGIIFSEFCRKGIFKGYHRDKHDFITEIQDLNLIRSFMELAKDRKIKGFKSARTLTLNW